MNPIHYKVNKHFPTSSIKQEKKTVSE